MEKRTLIALVLIMIIFWFSNEFLWKKNAQPVTEEQTGVNTEVVEEPVETVAEGFEDPVNSNLGELPVNTDLDLNNDIIMEIANLIVTLSNKGGVITSVKLKDYFFSDQMTHINLIPEQENIFNLKLVTDDESKMNLSSQIFEFYYIEEDQGVSFILRNESGSFVKTYRLDEGYELGLKIISEDFAVLDSYELSMDCGIADSEEYIIEHPKEKQRDYKIIAEVDNEIEKFNLSKLKEKRENLGKIDWASIRSKYFIIGIYADPVVDINRISAFNNNGSPAMELGVSTPRTSFSHEYSVYFGPQKRAELMSFRSGFEKVMEGPFLELLRPISNLFAVVFKFFRGFIPNYGIIIIIIAVLLKILLYPLTHKSFESTHKMQKVTPLMKELQAKYKNDPQTLNQEMRKLYKEHGVSPLGGCLPMLLQMPVIFAIYPVIRYSIDMRQNNFLWIPDLSEPDNLLILPIAMAIFMFVQQKLMSPSKAKTAEMDEKQQAAQQSQKMMMYIMPVMMFFIFKSLSAGLVLYWTVFSIIGTIQQYFIKKKFN